MRRIISFFRYWYTRTVMSKRYEAAEFRKAKGDESPIVLGHYAVQLVKNPALDAALQKIEMEIFHAWKTSPPKASEEREHLYYRLEGLAQIKLKLTGLVNNMLLEEKMAKKQGQSDEEAQKEI